MAVESLRWWKEQVPVTRLGAILMSLIFLSQKRQYFFFGGKYRR
jgi:hypothetical protein